MSRETSINKKTNAKKEKKNSTNIKKKSKQAHIKEDKNALSTLFDMDLLILGNLTLFSENYFQFPKIYEYKKWCKGSQVETIKQMPFTTDVKNNYCQERSCTTWRWEKNFMPIKLPNPPSPSKS